jgi:asparagine synthase (glutamine-hydrolysing)
MTDRLIHRGRTRTATILIRVSVWDFPLSIIDVGGSHQPMSNEDDSTWIVFNGKSATSRPRTQVHQKHIPRLAIPRQYSAYEDYGSGCVDYLRGMFAFAMGRP